MTENKRPLVLVTGGSRGIGAAVCRIAASAGCDVAFTYLSDAAAAASVCEQVAKAGGRAMAIQADVSVEADILRLFAAVDGFGRLTHLVNNAGITGKSGRLDATDPQVIAQTIAINVTGAILVAREAVKRMSTLNGGRGGAIVNISSAAATLGSPGEYTWYAASKGAIDSFTIGLSKELATEGIRVNAVQPGLIDTEIHDKSTGDAARVERLRPMIPMQRIGRADEVANAVFYLLSDAASYVTGSILRVSGGR